MAADSTVRVAFVGDTKDFRRAVNDVANSSKTIESRFSKLSRTFGTFTKLAAAGVAIKGTVDVFRSVTQAAADENREIALLNRQLKNAGIPESVIRSTDEWVTSLQNASAVADSELRPAFAALISSGLDYSNAQNVLRTALDVSTARGIKLQTVVLALSKAFKGNTSSLSRYGIQTKNAAGEALSFEEILGQLNDQFGGATAAAADTAAGKFEILKLKFEDMKERIGNALLPILEKLGTFLADKVVPIIEQKLVPAFERFAAWVNEQLPKLKAVFESVFGGADKLIGDLAKAFGTNKSTIIAAIGGIGAALVGLAVAWNAGPGIIITGIALLVVGFLYLYNESKEFRLGMQVLFGLLAKSWQQVEFTIRNGITLLVFAFDLLKGVLSSVREAWDRIVAAFKVGLDALQPIMDFLKELLSIALKVINAVKDVGETGKNLLPKGGYTPVLPGLASGGIVTKPTVAVIGEAGPEAVIPLSKMGMSSGLTVNIYGDVHSEVEFERKVTDALANARRRGVAA